MIQQRKQFKVLLIGDLCNDVTLNCVSHRENPESDAPLVVVEDSSTTLGMAGFVHECLTRLGINTVVSFPQVFGTKTRYVLHKYSVYENEVSNKQLLRIDDNVKSSPQFEYLTTAMLHGIDAVVVSDYSKGFISYDALKQINDECAKHYKPLFVDTKKNRLSNLDHAIIKINSTEASKVQSWPTQPVVVTKGAEGYEYDTLQGKALRTTALDVCGAGDAFLAGLVYGYLNSVGNMRVALKFGNYNAGLSVGRFGKYAPHKQEIDNLALREITSEGIFK